VAGGDCQHEQEKSNQQISAIETIDDRTGYQTGQCRTRRSYPAEAGDGQCRSGDGQAGPKDGDLREEVSRIP